MVRRRHRVTLDAHAAALTSLANAYRDLATRHRIAAASERRYQDLVRRHGKRMVGTEEHLSYEKHFDAWIYLALEFSWVAERLLELEIELAIANGASWDAIASTLGVKRQSAWERYGGNSRRAISTRINRLRQTRLWNSPERRERLLQDEFHKVLNSRRRFSRDQDRESEYDVLRQLAKAWSAEAGDAVQLPLFVEPSPEEKSMLNRMENRMKGEQS